MMDFLRMFHFSLCCRPQAREVPFAMKGPCGLLLLSFLILHLLEAPATCASRTVTVVARDGSVLTPFRESWAVVVGIDQYEHVKKLKFAVSDAKGVRDLLVNRFSFNADHVLTLFDEEATKSAILRVLGDQIPVRTKADDRLFIYFAGHEVTRHTTGYIWPVNAREGFYRSKAISILRKNQEKGSHPSAAGIREADRHTDEMPAASVAWVIGS